MNHTLSSNRRSGAGAHARLWAVLAAVVAFGGLSACEVPWRSAPQTSGPGSMWISRAEIARLPTSGAAWNNLVGAARSSWGKPSLSDNNAQHDTSTLAGALVAIRTGDGAMAAKTRASIMSVTRVTSYNRVLELSRNITSYVIAADIVDLSAADDAVFKKFIAGLRGKRLEGHSGGVDMYTTALRSANNWGAMARAGMTAIDLYLGDRNQLTQVANAHRAWLGDRVGNQLRFSSTSWQASSPPAGINRRGARVMGRSADGIQPEDQRRSGEPSTRSAPTQGSYPWEALQGAVVTGALLHRAGVVDINAGDRALRRAFAWLYLANANPPAGDDLWQPWVLNRIAGTRFPAAATRSPGKNMAWTDWTHR